MEDEYLDYSFLDSQTYLPGLNFYMDQIINELRDKLYIKGLKFPSLNIFELQSFIEELRHENYLPNLEILEIENMKEDFYKIDFWYLFQRPKFRFLVCFTLLDNECYKLGHSLAHFPKIIRYKENIDLLALSTFITSYYPYENFNEHYTIISKVRNSHKQFYKEQKLSIWKKIMYHSKNTSLVSITVYFISYCSIEFPMHKLFSEILLNKENKYYQCEIAQFQICLYRYIMSKKSNHNDYEYFDKFSKILKSIAFNEELDNKIRGEAFYYLYELFNQNTYYDSKQKLILRYVEIAESLGFHKE